jgi:hypothetical protein
MKVPRGLKLSISEDEYVVISEAVKEIKFISNLLIVIGFEVNLPIKVETENVGAVFMAQSAPCCKEESY